MSNMIYIDASYNEIEMIPNDFTKLSNLRYLDLSHNSIEIMFTAWGDARNLQYLDLSFNLLTDFVKENFDAMAGITKMNLSDNQLYSFKDDFACLHILRELDLSNNNINSMPNEINKMKNLHTLNVITLNLLLKSSMIQKQ